MSVIVWDGKLLAADSRRASGNTFMSAKKIERINGCLVAGTGTVDWIEEMVDLWSHTLERLFPECQKKDDFAELIVVIPAVDGSGVVVHHYLQSRHPVVIEHPWAWGAGREFAMAALGLGLSAPEAVEVAIRHCHYCGPPVQLEKP